MQRSHGFHAECIRYSLVEYFFKTRTVSVLNNFQNVFDVAHINRIVK